MAQYGYVRRKNTRTFELNKLLTSTKYRIPDNANHRGFLRKCVYDTQKCTSLLYHMRSEKSSTKEHIFMKKNNTEISVPRTALYIRVSTDEQALHGLSLEAQQAALEKWAHENSCKIVGTYIDGGKTARKSLKSRTELMRLLSDVEADKIDLIIFTKLDRWFRNIKDYYKVQEILENHNVNWKTIFENYDTSTANGRLHINIMLSIAQDEADRTSERIKAVFANKIARGEATTASLPIGYKLVDKHVVVDEEHAQIAVDLFEHYYIHQNQRATGRAITDAHNVHLSPATIKHMLTNTLYKGVYRGINNFCEPLIDAAKFDEIQTILESKNIKQTPTEYDFIFTGLLICKECGSNMYGNAQRRVFSGGIHGWYVCYRCNKNHNFKTCPHNKVMNERKIEEYLLKNIENEISRYICNFEASKAKKKVPKINKQEIKRKLERLKDLYVNDLINMDVYKKDYAELNNKLLIAETQEPQQNLNALKEFLESDFLKNYDTFDNKSKRVMWRGIINRLIIDADNNITIEFTK